MDLTIGRKGLLGYLKALGGSNVIKVIPSNGSASGSQATDKRLKVICGANTSYLADSEWIGDNTPVTLCDVRVSPNNFVKPNIGASELSEALNRVLPFTATDDSRPILQCVNFVAKEGKLTLVSADGFRLAKISLDYDDGEGQGLLNTISLTASALRGKPQRMSISGSSSLFSDSVSGQVAGLFLSLTWISRFKAVNNSRHSSWLSSCIKRPLTLLLISCNIAIAAT